MAYFKKGPSFGTGRLPIGTADAFLRFDQCVPHPFMVALSMIMMDELRDGPGRPEAPAMS